MKLLMEMVSPLISNIFIRQGWEMTNYIEDANLVVFTGGPDVSPMLYDSKKHPKTQCDPVRDQKCHGLYLAAIEEEVPMVGICRGAQFLNIMCGGDMFQHVDNHAIQGTHAAQDLQSGSTITVTSTHHQMMIPNMSSAKVLLTANESTVRELEHATGEKEMPSFPDYEALFYEEEKCLCYQPHPEYVNTGHECSELFFSYIKRYLTKKGD